MNRVFRITILLIAGIFFVFLAREGVTRAFGGTPASSQGASVVELQALPPQAPAPAARAGQAAVANQQQGPNAALDGLIWNDLDHDGLQDWKERGIPNVTVTLYTSANTVVGTTKTNGNGAYRFQNLTPGDYFVVIQLPPGYVFSPEDQGQNDLVDSDTDPATAATTPVTLVAGENSLVWTTGIYDPTAPVRPNPGTVQPPPSEIQVCSAGVYSVGGVSTLQVNQLAPDYCIHAFLWNHGFAVGRIPDGAGDFLAAVTFVEFFYQGTFVYKYDVPSEANSILVCYAMPVGKQGQIYFYDHYGPKFGQPAGQPSWVPLETTIQNGVACAVAQTSGGYALIGK